MTTQTEVTITQLDPGKLLPSPHNPRRHATPEGLKELAGSLAAQGVLEPLLVRPVGKGKHEILAGHRRAAAAVMACLPTVPCIVREVDDKTAIEITVTENMQREQLSPLEEAAGLESLAAAGWNAETMAAELGKSPKWVARRMSLLGLAPEIRKTLVEGGKLKVTMPWGAKETVEGLDRWPARSLEIMASVPAEVQTSLLVCVARDRHPVPSPATMNGYLARCTHLLKAAPFDVADPTLNPKQGACTACDLRSSCRKSLFDDAETAKPAAAADDKCLNPACFDVKLVEHGKRALADAKAKHGAGNVVAVCDDHESRRKFKGYEGVPYNVGKASKDAKGAKFYFDVGSGKGAWMAPESATRQKTGSGKKAKPATVPMKERRAALEKRRLAIVLRNLQEQLGKKDFAGHNSLAHRTQDLVMTAAQFGTHENRNGHNEYHHKSNPWRAKLLDQQLYALNLAVSVGKVLQERARTAVDYGRDAADMLAEATGICELYDLQFDVLKAAADAEIPEPKSWAKLNADGSVKQAKGKVDPVKLLGQMQAAKKRKPITQAATGRPNDVELSDEEAGRAPALAKGATRPKTKAGRE